MSDSTAHLSQTGESDSGRTGITSTVVETLTHGATIGVVDVRRTVRKAVDTKTQLAAFLLVVGLFGAGVGYGSYLFGREMGLGADLPVDWSVLEIARGGFALLWLFLTIIVVVRTVGTRGELANDVGILSVVPTREAAVGMLLSESALAASYALPLFLAGSVGYSVATGAWGLVLTAPVAALSGTVAAAVVGYPIGLALRHVLTRIEFVARNKAGLIVLAFVAYMALILSGALGNVMVRIFEPMQQAPTGWFADLALLGSAEVSVDLARAGAALVLTPALAAVGAVATTRAATRHWFADPVLASADENDPSREGTAQLDSLQRVEGSIANVIGRPAAAITVLAWKRAVRAPLKLLYVAYPLLFVVGFIGDIVQTGEVPVFAPAFALVFVAWAGAVVFTLNPLGDQGAALPATLLSRTDGREFVGAHIAAGAIVTIPLGTAVTAAIAVLSPLENDLVAAIVLTTPLSILVGSAFAVGIGMAFPRYDAVNISRSTKAVVPSLLAFAVFSAYLLLVVAAGAIVYEPVIGSLVAALLSWVLPFGLSVGADAVGTGALVALVPLGIAPFASAYYAVRRFDSVTVA